MRKAVFLLLLLMATIIGIRAQQNVSAEGRVILERADRRIYPTEGTWSLFLKTTNLEGQNLEFRLKNYINPTANQTAVWTFPSVNKGDVAMKMNNVIYNKQAKWSKPQILSYQSVFVDSAFSYGDVISTNLSADYQVVSIQDRVEQTVDCHLLTLSPLRGGLYAKIEVYVQKSNFNTLRRSYYTASGELEKDSRFSGFTEIGGRLTGFVISMKNLLLEIDSTAEISEIKPEKLPSFLFDPQNIGRIHAN